VEKGSLLFVYNANSGGINAVKDFANKIFNPSSYGCQLCAITYGNLGVRKKWKEFIEKLPHDAYFYHKDEFTKEFSILENQFPAVFYFDGKQPKLLIPTEELSAMTLEQLIKDITAQLNGN
jgi:hypothetical protein